MKLDIPPAIATAAEAEWVEGELVRSLMRTARNTQLVGLVLIPIFVGVLWGDAPTSWLLLWALAALAVAAARFVITGKYVREVMIRDAAAHLSFFSRYRALWPISALVWGISTLLYFDHSSLDDQFICWLMMAGLAMFSVNSLSSHLATLRAYLDTLALTAVAIMLWRIGVELQFHGPHFHYWVIVLLVIFWQVLRQAGLRLHETHRSNFELQYRNNQLIESLTRQTQAALVHEIAPKIVESTKAVNALFDSLFDLVRLDSGKIKLNIEPVDLGQLL